jgi:hypothetical protein
MLGDTLTFSLPGITDLENEAYTVSVTPAGLCSYD